MAGALGCEPFVHNVPDAAQYNEDFAVKLYGRATVLDGFPGEYPPTDTGSSGLAVAKAAQSFGLIKKYQHAFTLIGLKYALRSGPVIVGVPWYESMFHTDVNGMVVANGKIVGGHEFLVRGYDNGVFFADNSWGNGWGVNGSFRFTDATWNTLRANGADVTVPQR
jgi:hypothetical protein